MDATKIIADNDLELFVREILVFENEDSAKNSRIPFFADGYPGIIYRQSENKAFLLPRKKVLSMFFLYGQTIEPIEFSMDGAYLFIVFQLYPFASKLLFDVDPKKLNDDCYDLSTVEGANRTLEALAAVSQKESQLEIIAKFIAKLARKKAMEEYREIQRAIEIVTDHRGLITIHTLAQLLNTSERTLQRKFNHYVGISPKKFAKIIQFQTSVEQISTGSFSKLTDVVYENGYADQSHFIRNIKKFTGKRPLQLKSPK